MAEATYLEMSYWDLGDMATSEDFEIFIDACVAYQELANCTAAEATEFIWNNGDWMKAIVSDLTN
jgi:hypothetical protein